MSESARRQMAWYRANRDRVVAQRWAKHVKRKYGLTVESVSELEAAQGGRCAICLGRLGTGRKKTIDHSHSTGKIRGMLCSNCNLGLGLFKDSPARLLRAAEYLKQNEDLLLHPQYVSNS